MSAPEETPRVSATYRTRIGWSDTDASGHYHNSTIIRLIEAAEALLVRERGITGWFGVIPRVRTEIDYAGRLWFDQPVACELVLERMGRTSMSFTFEVWGEDFDGHRGGRAASGRLVVVHAPDLSGRAEPWPDAWRAAFTG